MTEYTFILSFTQDLFNAIVKEQSKWNLTTMERLNYYP